MTEHFPTDALRHWPQPFAAANVLQEHAGFSGARIWKIEVLKQPFALRMWPAESLALERLHGLHRFLQFLSHRGLTFFSIPVPDRAGNTLVTDAGRLWQLEPWMPGRADFGDNPSDSRLRAAMIALARFHLTAAEYDATPDHAEWFGRRAPAPSPGLNERLQKIDCWRNARPASVRREIESAPLAPAIRSSLAGLWDAFVDRSTTLRRQLAAVQTETVSLQPVLRDVWHDHLLFTGERLAGIIDPSACRIDNPAVDLARLLGSLLGPDDAARRAKALSFYETVRPMSPAEHRLLPVLEATQFPLAGLTWIERLTRRSAPLDNQTAVRHRLEMIADRIRRANLLP